jgi:glycosyltransferase involved in cell wall biosynthesis
MQEPPTGVSKDEPWYEILIHDDASTDGTSEIIKEYAAKYPDRIFPLYEEENQYKRLGAARIDVYNYGRVKGKYVAYCEGDDYWTNPKKLQKQVDFMEAHPDYSICWHRVQLWFKDTDTIADDKCGALLPEGEEGVDIDLSTYFTQWSTQPLSMLFRSSMFDIHWRDQYRYYRDQHEMYHLLKQGKGYLFAFHGGVYVKHEGGIYSSLSYGSQGELGLSVARELYKQNKDKYTKSYYESTLQWLIYANKQVFKLKLQYSLELFRLNFNLKILIKNMLRHS